MRFPRHVDHHARGAKKIQEQLSMSKRSKNIIKDAAAEAVAFEVLPLSFFDWKMGMAQFAKD